MRKTPEQSYADWLDQIKKKELDLAKKQLSRGVSIEFVLEEFAENFFKKSMHPLYKMLTNEFQNFRKK